MRGALNFVQIGAAPKENLGHSAHKTKVASPSLGLWGHGAVWPWGFGAMGPWGRRAWGHGAMGLWVHGAGAEAPWWRAALGGNGASRHWGRGAMGPLGLWGNGAVGLWGCVAVGPRDLGAVGQRGLGSRNDSSRTQGYAEHPNFKGLGVLGVVAGVSRPGSPLFSSTHVVVKSWSASNAPVTSPLLANTHPSLRM